MDKQLKIQTNVVKRLKKELSYYEKEAEDQKTKIQTLEQNKGDEYVIKKQREVLDESLGMIPHTSQRLDEAIQKLKSLVEEYTQEDDLRENAVRILEEVENGDN